MNEPGSSEAVRSAPGSRRKRYKRWTRATTWITLGALVAFVSAMTLLFTDIGRDHHEANTQALLIRLHNAIRHVKSSSGAYPRTLLDLDAVARGELAREDGYGTLIRYSLIDDGTGVPAFDLRSAGPDKTFDTEDDLIPNA